jgi:Putative peptidoglycan binding domain
MSGTARDLLTWAARQVGTLEKPAGSNNQPYAAIAGHPNGQAWCGTFIVAGLKANEVPLVPGTNTGFTPTMHDAFARAGRLFDEPRAGDAGFKFHAELNRIAHVFFVEKVVGDFVQTIEGNTNTDGSRTGIGVFRLRRRWRNGGTLRGFGRPMYGLSGPPRAVSLSNVVEAARLDPPAAQGATSHPADVKIVEAALMAEGLLSPAFAKDGSFGTVTVTAYSQFQKQQGFKGPDADGIPGRQTLTALGNRHGFAVKD